MQRSRVVTSSLSGAKELLRPVAGFVVLGLLVAACGSTLEQRAGDAPLSQGGTFESGTADSLGLGEPQQGTDPGSVQSTESGGGVGSLGATDSGGAASSAGSPGSPGEAAAGGSPAPVRSSAAPEQGKPVEIGVWSLDGRATAALLGANGYRGQPFDDDRMINAVFNDMNARGGLLGHPVKPVIYDADPLNQEPAGQEACSLFTQDHKVVGIGGWGTFESNTLLACIAQKSIPTSISNAGSIPDFTAEDFAKHPTIQMPMGFTWDREAEPFVANLQAMDYFKGWDINTGAASPAAPVRIGVVADDTERWRKIVSNYVGPALARRGLKIEAQGYASTNAAQAQRDWQSIALQFKSQNISHILLLVPQSGNLLVAAEGGRYRPRYAIDTKVWPYPLTEGLAPEAQLAGVVGIGWQPSRDTAEGDWPPANAQQTRCEQLMQKVGVDTRDQLQRFVALLICDMAWALEAAFKAGGDVTPRAFVNGMRGMGASFVTATTFKTEFRGGRADGVAAIRRFAHSPACGCFRYTSGLIDVG